MVDTTDHEVTFQDVLQKFTDHFLPRMNVTFERHLFFVRDQEDGESADRYVTALRTGQNL